MNTKPLVEALTVPGFTTFIEDEGDTLYVRWTENSGEHEQWLVNLRYPGSAAEGELKLLHPGAEWTLLIVEPWARNKGIFTAVVGIPTSLLKKLKLYPLHIAQDAPAQDFYRSVGFEDADDGLMARNDEAFEAWRNRD